MVHTFANWRFLQDSEVAVRRVLLRVGQYVVANITSVHVSIDIEIYHEVLAEVTESQKQSKQISIPQMYAQLSCTSRPWRSLQLVVECKQILILIASFNGLPTVIHSRAFLHRSRAGYV